SAEGMEAAINSGSIDMVGIAKPLVINPDLPNQIINGTYITPDLPRITTNVKFIDKKLGSMIELSWYEAQFYLMAHGKILILN
ncbi:NADH oxidase, partial [Staphylococcus haemolyticus]|nr:NADH oxidase [Staphylococcus haemolyticus]